MKKTHDPTRSATLDLLKKIEEDLYSEPLSDQFLDVVEKCCRRRFKRSRPISWGRAAGIGLPMQSALTGIEAMLKKLEDETKEE